MLSLWCGCRGIVVADWLPAASGGMLLGIAISGRGAAGLRPKIAAAEWVLLWLAFAICGALLTYLAATRDGPLFDAEFAAADAALGFDWGAWHQFVFGHPLLYLEGCGLRQARPAGPVLGAWLLHRGEWRRFAELLTAAIVALLLASALFALFPSFGPATRIPDLRATYVHDLAGLRSGTLPSLDVMLLKGVIAFPSFHAVFAVLFTTAHARLPSFWPVAPSTPLCRWRCRAKAATISSTCPPAARSASRDLADPDQSAGLTFKRGKFTSALLGKLHPALTPVG